ncbi:hypothetical protein Q7P37_002999 [Cladosporium fusiforme]
MARYPTYDEYRDKPKKGITKCDELLKRTPKNIHLLATKSQLLTELGETSKAQSAIDQLLAIQPATRDLQEISLIEDAVVEHQQSNSFPQPQSAGPEVAKLWENAAKAATTLNYKLDLQSLRFTRAIFDNRLQDAQQALIQLKLLMPKNRNFYMAHAIVTQMLSTGSEDLSSRLAISLAKKAVTEKFDEDKSLDCRVPGQIFALQGKKEELEGIKAGRFGESKQVHDALRVPKQSGEEEGLAGLKIGDAKLGTPEWLDDKIAEFKIKSSSLLKGDTDKKILYTFASEAAEAYHLAVSSIDQFRYRHVCQLVFLAISALVKIWEQHNEPDALLQAALLGEMLLRNNQHIHEAKVILVYLYMRLDLATLALKHWDSLSVKEIQFDTIGHAFLTNLSITHPQKATTSTARNNDPLSITTQGLAMYTRYEQKLAESEANVLNNGQTGMILDLHQLRSNLRLSLTRRLLSLEQRRYARFFRNPPLDTNAVHIEPRLTAHWLEAKDNRDFAAAFNYGYNVERALYGEDKDGSRAWILRSLAADTAWCLANNAVSPVKDPEVLLEQLSALEQEQVKGKEDQTPSLPTATLRFLTTPSTQTLSALTSALKAQQKTSEAQSPPSLKETYLHLSDLRTLRSLPQSLSPQISAPALTALRKSAEEGIADLLAKAKAQVKLATEQNVRADFASEHGVWGSFGKEEIENFAGAVADARGRGWEGVGLSK